jgi:hypothetical protein
MMGNTSSVYQDSQASWAHMKYSSMKDVNPTSAFVKKGVPVPGIAGRSNAKKNDQTADS